MSDAASSPSEVVASYLAAFDTRDPERIAAHVSADFANRHTAALGSSCDGRGAYLERLPDFLAGIPDLHFEVEQLVTEGPDVAAFYTMTGRWQGQSEFSVRGIQHLRVQALLVVGQRDVIDGGNVKSLDDRALTDIAEQGNLTPFRSRDFPVTSAQQNVGLDTDGS